MSAGIGSSLDLAYCLEQFEAEIEVDDSRFGFGNTLR